MKYVLYEGKNGDMLFTKEELVIANPSLLAPFENKQPTFTTEANDDSEAISMMNAFIASRAHNKS